MKEGLCQCKHVVQLEEPLAFYSYLFSFRLCKISVYLLECFKNEACSEVPFQRVFW